VGGWDAAEDDPVKDASVESPFEEDEAEAEEEEEEEEAEEEEDGKVIEEYCDWNACDGFVLDCWDSDCEGGSEETDDGRFELT
jgi:hypothetical protein